MGVFDLEEQFTFYASYHNERRNQLVHYVGVWPILFTALIFLSYTAEIVPTPVAITQIPLGEFIKFNASAIVSAIYCSYYLFMEVGAGTVAALLVVMCYVSANAIVMTDQNAWQWALVVHISCWVVQILSHKVFEGRAPALLDNIVQAFLMAPLFVLMELFFDFGYKPAFRVKIQKMVDEAVGEFHKNSEKKEI